MLESEVTEQIKTQCELGLHAGVVIWRNNIGVTKQGGRVIKYGVGGNGGADFIGAVRLDGSPLARLFCVEVKSDTGRQRPEQKLFQNVVTQIGGYYCMVRSAAEVTEHIARAKRGEPGMVA